MVNISGNEIKAVGGLGAIALALTVNFSLHVNAQYSQAEDITGGAVENLTETVLESIDESGSIFDNVSLIVADAESLKEDLEEANQSNGISTFSLTSNESMKQINQIEFNTEYESPGNMDIDPVDFELDMMEERKAKILEDNANLLNEQKDSTEVQNEESTEDDKVIEEPIEQVQQTVVITSVSQEGSLLEIAEPDENYNGAIVQLSDEDRYILEHLVMGEAGNQGYEGAALVAQCIRDTMVYDGISSVESVRTGYKYSGSLNHEPNQDVLNAVSYVFDQGGVVVKHRIQYFYAPKYAAGKWHETQHFIIEYGGHRFFSRW